MPSADEKTTGHFDPDGSWHPEDPTVENTYQMPDISAGFLFDLKEYGIYPSLSVELLDMRRIKIDSGVAVQRIYLYGGYRWTSIFELSTGLWAGIYIIEDKGGVGFNYGIAMTIMKF